jgi:hypothetical protein
MTATSFRFSVKRRNSHPQTALLSDNEKPFQREYHIAGSRAAQRSLTAQRHTSRITCFHPLLTGKKPGQGDVRIQSLPIRQKILHSIFQRKKKYI